LSSELKRKSLEGQKKNDEHERRCTKCYYSPSSPSLCTLNVLKEFSFLFLSFVVRHKDNDDGALCCCCCCWVSLLRGKRFARTAAPRVDRLTLLGRWQRGAVVDGGMFTQDILVLLFVKNEEAFW